MITLTPHQQQCSDMVVEWDENQTGFKQVFRVDGYAGTGKSSTIMHTINRMGGSTLFAAYTGKAASVMQANGCPDAQTIHSLIYKPSGSGADRQAEADSIQDEIEELVGAMIESGDFSEKEARDDEEVKEMFGRLQQITAIASAPQFRINTDSPIRDADRIVIDESSMVGEDIGKDLLSFRVPVIVMGDPGQLPPVFGEGFFTRGDPDFLLSEIHRQAADSPVLKMATMARKGQPLKKGTDGLSGVFDGVPKGMGLNADQIIVGRNATRRLTNDSMREMLGYVPKGLSTKESRAILPKKGEKVICLKNNNKLGLLNGTLWHVRRCHQLPNEKLSLTVVPEEGGEAITLVVHEQYFKSPHNDPKKIQHEIGWEMQEAECFDHGACITAHKAQGSQWKNVMVIDESRAFRKDANKWLYTAITRAQENCWVCRV